MKILIINSVCGIRSTGRICMDLAKMFSERGHDVRIAYGREVAHQDSRRFSVKIGNALSVRLHGIKARVFDADGFGSKRATRKFLRWVKEFDPDVIHLNNLHGYYLNLPELFKYLAESKKPVLWSLHDFWAFTGHSGTCDSINCEKWQSQCEKCPLYNRYPKTFIDRSSRNFVTKKALFAKAENLTLVAASRWMAEKMRCSFFKNNRIELIPNGVDTTKFFPRKGDFREQHGLTDKIVLLGCASAWGKTKGLDDFKKLADRLDDRFAIVLVGLTASQISEMPSNILCIERTNDIAELAQLYTMADVFVNLSYVDVFSMVNREAICCGTPVITYRTGGCAECVRDKWGKVFEKGDVEGVISYLQTEYDRTEFDVKCDFSDDPSDINTMSEKYLKLINELNGSDK